MARTKPNASKDSSENLGFEAKLWLATDKLRNYMDAAECKHVVLGLIFSNTSPTSSRNTTPNVAIERDNPQPRRPARHRSRVRPRARRHLPAITLN